MIVDSSAILAAFFAERDRERILQTLMEADGALAGAPALFESELAAAGRIGPVGAEGVRAFVQAFEIEAMSFGDAHRREATAAYLEFGKGRHPAKLNFGDCMTYAIARIAKQPLLCIGDDFAKTDLDIVPLPD